MSIGGRKTGKTDASCRQAFEGVCFAYSVDPIIPIEEYSMKKIRARNVCAALFGVAALAMAAYSQDKQDKKEGAEMHKIVHFGDLKWTPIIKGCDLAHVAGDPNAEGAPFVLRIRCADG